MGFALGDILVTKGINERIQEDDNFSAFVMKSFQRYIKRDWGDLGKEDKTMNDSAVKNNDDRIFARYNYGSEAIYIITEYDRSATTILFIYEY